MHSPPARPSQVRETLWSDYAATRAVEPASAAEARIDSMLQEAQEASAQTVAAGRTAARGRGRPRGAVADPQTAAPATARGTRRGGGAVTAAADARQPVPKFDAPVAGDGQGEPESPVAAIPGPSSEAAGGGAENRGGGAAAEGAAAAPRGAEAQAQARARVDAKLAALEGTAPRGTAARGAMPGEMMYSKRGEGVAGEGGEVWLAPATRVRLAGAGHSSVPCGCDQCCGNTACTAEP
jgi:hypothetical protein